MRRTILPSDPWLDRVRGEQARILFRNCPVGVTTAGIAAIILAIGLEQAGRVNVRDAHLCIVMMIGCVLLHLTLCMLFWRVKPLDASWRRWLGWFTFLALLEGITWFLGAFWMTSATDTGQELVVALLAGVVAIGAVPVFGSYYPAFLVYMLPVVAPHLYFSLAYDYSFHELMAGLVVTYVVGVPFIARIFNRQLVTGLNLRFQNLSLIEDLREQKERADQANRAKSNFLASASHDLRQPIHALGLFIGALRGQPLNDEANRLVDHISGSVSAMDDLFGSLLDISKLDADVVLPRIEPMAIAPLLERLYRDYLGDAAAKAIELRHVRCDAIVDSDPILLERVLRNIISNAVRYTDAGRILMGCRHGLAGITVEVWDTGCGIAPSQQQHIFEEFYQIDNPERDRSKGLGLGLAIVKRIAPLIGSTLKLDSQPGRGSVFRLSVPRAAGGILPVVHETTSIGAMRTGFILVIDDEIAIQLAMSTLLTSWHHRVFVAGSVEDMLVQLADCYDKPDLIITDFRLRGGETGLHAIQQLYDYFNDDIPAMLITGDTAPDRINEAKAGGFLLLHKPLSNSKLRAAIARLMSS
jgi:signal transduction histidine kinase/CheY-like chemotaxis protein